MCGRFTLKTPAATLIEHFGFDRRGLAQLELFGPRYNVAPTQQAPVIRLGDATDGQPQGRELELMRWGLIPSWTRQMPSSRPLINARSETVADKPSFRAAFRRRRCLVPIDGFYEWQPVGGQKQPYYIRRPDQRPFALAGLWEYWDGGQPPAGPPLASFAILTTSANGLMRTLHDRMPVILAPLDWDRWLAPGEEPHDLAELQHLLAPAPDDELVADPVSKRVNQVRHDDPECIRIERDLFADS